MISIQPFSIETFHRKRPQPGFIGEIDKLHDLERLWVAIAFPSDKVAVEPLGSHVKGTMSRMVRHK